MVLQETKKGIPDFDVKKVGNPQPGGCAPSTHTHTHLFNGVATERLLTFQAVAKSP